MPNAIKYNTSAETLALKKGNFYIGTGDVGKGPTSSTGYYNGITPPSGGYTIYLNKESGGPSIYTVTTEAQLTGLTTSIAGQSLTTSGACLNWFATQTDKMILNKDYQPIITNGLIINLDGGFTPSYPTTGATWYNTSLNANNTSLLNGPAYTSSYGGGIFFDGADDYLSIPYFNITTQPFAVEVWYQPSNNTTYLRGILSCGDVYSGTFSPGWCLGTHQAGLQLMFAAISGPSTRYQVISNTTMISGNIYHLFFTRNTSTQKLLLYVNGILDGSMDIPNDASLTGNRTSITSATWAYSPPGPYGNIFSTRIYDNKNFSAAEIAQNYCATLPIVTNGLVFNVDAGTQLSYVSGSTAWVDTAGNTVGTLTNGPTYNSSNLGSIVFDGVNDYVAWPNNPLSSLTSITYECWFKFNSGFGNGFTISGPTLEAYLEAKNTWYTDRISRNNFSWTFNTNWNQLIFTYSSGAGAAAYINGVSLTVNSGGGLSSQSTLWIGNRINLDSTINGNIAITRVYNRVLTSSEVLQNYNATKGRFGL